MNDILIQATLSHLLSDLQPATSGLKAFC